MEENDLQWIVQGRAVENGVVAKLVASDPELRVLKKSGNDMVVLIMTEPRAEKLKSELGAAAIIERDAELPDPRL